MVMAFWGVVVHPGEPYIHEPSRGRRLKIRQAMLGDYGDAGWSLLECNVGDKEPVRLCALNPTDAFMCHLKLEYEEKETVILTVSGNGSIHLSGYYIHSCNGDHGHCSDKLTRKSASVTCLERTHKGDEADGKNDASPKEPIISEADGKNDVYLKEPIVSEDGDEANGKNGASPKVAIVSEADAKNDAPLKEPVVKRRATKKRRTKTLGKEHMLSDQNNNMGQVNVQKDSKIMESNAVHIVPTQDQEVTREGNVVQCSAAATNQRIRQTSPLITDKGLFFIGATELQGVKKQNEDAEHSGSIHAGKGPIHKVTLDDGIRIEDLDVGKANGKIASDGSKVTVKYVCKLMNGQAVDPMDDNNILKFKLGK
ncbi:peptidyl-prolyl cis-trans isomerase FKBP43-like [Phragmites australis]|uniref:peptidyl-prolyl cis-trans isomerase FKBP43-like n=1 Tax=Phragmites australis TaxID=29695 RepID=UPI002D7A395A|nr:peptidyl-prolyl cis-trans isomerase FKBP43-like [Phragmites australis]